MAVPEPITRLEQYWAAILDKIQGGGSAPVLVELQVNVNGEYTPEEGVDGFDYVNVQVPDPVVYGLTVTENGTYTPESGFDGFDEVVVSVPQHSYVMDILVATANGTYTPGSGYDGFDQVVVAVEQEWHTVTFTGTLAAPFTLANLSYLDNADIIYGEMAIDATVIGAGSASAYFNRTSGTLSFSVVDIPSTTVSDVTAAAVAIAIDDDPPAVRLESARMMQQGAIVDVSQYASLMPTTTTFVYHTPSSND